MAVKQAVRNKRTKFANVLSSKEQFFFKESNLYLPMCYAYCEGGMQKQHKEMRCTCCQLVLVLMWPVLPSRHKMVLLLARMSVYANRYNALVNSNLNIYNC